MNTDLHKQIKVKINKKLIAALIAISLNMAYAKSKPEITSDRMEMRRSENIVIFTGNVKGYITTKDKEIIRFVADKAVFNEKDDITVLSGSTQPYVIYESTAVSLTRIFADKIHINNSTDKIDFESNVRVIQKNQVNNNDNIITGQYGTYDNLVKTIEMNNGNVTYYSDEYSTEFSANLIIMYLNEQRLVLEQKVHGYLSKL